MIVYTKNKQTRTKIKHKLWEKTVHN